MEYVVLLWSKLRILEVVRNVVTDFAGSGAASRDLRDSIPIEATAELTSCLREGHAEEIAEVLLVLFGDVDQAEDRLAAALAIRADHCRLLWRDVLTYLAQVRG